MITVEAPALAQPLTIAESGTLTEYLSEHFAQHLIPKRYQEGKEGQVGGETEEWLRYRFYMHYAEGSLMTLLLIGLFMDRKCYFSTPTQMPSLIATNRNPQCPCAILHQAHHQDYRWPRRYNVLE